MCLSVVLIHNVMHLLLNFKRALLFMEPPTQESYGASLAKWDHIVLPVVQYKFVP